MSTTKHDWIVVYRVQFDSLVNAESTHFGAPEKSKLWRFGPENVALDSNGLPNYQAHSWGGFALYTEYQDAAAHACAPLSGLETSHNIVEIWSALLVPIAHRGEVDWRGQIESETAIRPAEQDLDGELAVITSAGFNSHEPSQISRIANFTQSSDQIMRDFKACKGNIQSSIFYAMHDGQEGLTFSLWQNDQAMLDAAYSSGNHAAVVKGHLKQPMMDRISITRARVISSYGDWTN